MLDLGYAGSNISGNGFLKKTEKPNGNTAEAYSKLQDYYKRARANQDPELRQEFFNSVLAASPVVGTELWEAIAKFKYKQIQEFNSFKNPLLLGAECYMQSQKIVVRAYDAALSCTFVLDEVLSMIDHDASHCSYHYLGKFAKSRLPDFRYLSREEAETFARSHWQMKLSNLVFELVANMDMIAEVNNGRRVVTREFTKECMGGMNSVILKGIESYTGAGGVVGRWMKELNSYLETSGCLKVKPERYAKV